MILEDALTEITDRGGHPIGSTIENCQIQELAQRLTVNFVAMEYAMRLKKREKEGRLQWRAIGGGPGRQAKDGHLKPVDRGSPRLALVVTAKASCIVGGVVTSCIHCPQRGGALGIDT